MSDVRWHVMAVVKGDKNIPANVTKANSMAVVMNFVAKANGYPVHDGDGFFMILVPNRVENDVAWFVDHVFRYVDIQKSTTWTEASRTADRLLSKAKEADPSGYRYAGAKLIEYFAHQMYMPYEEWEPDASRFEVRLR